MTAGIFISTDVIVKDVGLWLGNCSAEISCRFSPVECMHKTKGKGNVWWLFSLRSWDLRIPLFSIRKGSSKYVLHEDEMYIRNISFNLVKFLFNLDNMWVWRLISYYCIHSFFSFLSWKLMWWYRKYNGIIFSVLNILIAISIKIHFLKS